MATQKNKLGLALQLIASNTDAAISFLNAELSAPNIPFPTMGGEVFWDNLAEYNGWRIQQNMFTKHARILDPDDVRRAWGTVNGMFAAMDRLVASMKNDRYNDTPKMNSTEAADRLMRLKMLYDAGALTKEEFEKKKSELIDFI